MMGPAQVVFILAVAALTIVAVVLDVRSGRLPNWLTVPAFFAGLLFHGITGLLGVDPVSGPTGAAGSLLFALGGFATGFGILLVLWLAGGSGGGDVKLMGALGSWLGAWLTFQALVASAVFAGLCSLLMLVLESFGLSPFSPPAEAAQSRGGGKKKAGFAAPRRSWLGRRGAVPYGVPAALGTWSVLALEWTGRGIPWPPLP